jgi:hypothetical protein
MAKNAIGGKQLFSFWTTECTIPSQKFEGNTLTHYFPCNAREKCHEKPEKRKRDGVRKRKRIERPVDDDDDIRGHAFAVGTVGTVGTDEGGVVVEGTGVDEGIGEEEDEELAASSSKRRTFLQTIKKRAWRTHTVK